MLINPLTTAFVFPFALSFAHSGAWQGCHRQWKTLTFQSFPGISPEEEMRSSVKALVSLLIIFPSLCLQLVFFQFSLLKARISFVSPEILRLVFGENFVSNRPLACELRFLGKIVGIFQVTLFHCPPYESDGHCLFSVHTSVEILVRLIPFIKTNKLLVVHGDLTPYMMLTPPLCTGC